MGELFGKSGIDTPYEREIIDYHPNLQYPQKTSTYQIDADTLLKIERSQTFTISQTLIHYEELVQELDQILQNIRARNSTPAFQQYLSLLQENQPKSVINFEEEHSGYQQSGDMEIYTILYRLRQSAEERRGFMDRYFRTQLSKESKIDQIQQEEQLSIQKWLNTEYELKKLEHQSLEYEDAFYGSEQEYYADPELGNEVSLLKSEIAQTERQRKDLENLHVSLADAAYIHRNRYEMFKHLIQQLKPLVYHPQMVLQGNVKHFILQLAKISDLSSVRVHLILAFRQLKEKHRNLKGQLLMIDDNKETFISKKQWMYQQVQVKSNESIKQWLENQTEGANPAIDLFAQIMTGSVKQSQQNYNQSMTDMLKFYKNEAAFYEQQIHLIQKKEEIRVFFKIMEDIEAIGGVSDEWVTEYLITNGYAG